MRKIRVEDAVGMALCHDITEMRDGFKGPVFKRGHVIREEDIPKMLDVGKQTVFVWEDQAGEIHEEDAALRMAAMTPLPPRTYYTDPSEGKVVLTAEERGFFRVDTELLRSINSIGDLTICTIPDHFPVEAGDRLASMRIVPLVTKEEQILRAEEICRGKKLFDLLPYRHLKVGIVITGSEVYTGRIKDKFEPVLRSKLAHYPADILGVSICDDDLSMITKAGSTFLSQGADLLIFTGGMSVDPDDLTPTAVRSLGADIVTHGMPSQPGNMTMVAYLGKTAILGVPGAAISRPVTTLDVLLPQVFAGPKLTKDDLIRLGDGGFCRMCSVCHFPTCTFGRY